MKSFLKRKSKWLLVLLFVPSIALAGDIQWNIQLHWQTPHHGPATGNIGTPPQHNHRPRGHNHYPDSYHNHPHFYNGRYGWHYHQGRRYPVVYQYHNLHGEYCREFEMNIYIGGYPQLAWGVACRNRAGFWRLRK
jgi:hypothetical protein